MDPQPPEGGPPEPRLPDPPPPTAPPERTSGLTVETCYRHPNVTTGVHCTRCGRPICPDCMNDAPVGYQCPECVREARGRLPRRRSRLVVGGSSTLVNVLIGANVLMFLIEVAAGGAGSLLAGPDGRALCNLGAMFSPALAQGQYWRLITAMFLHAGLIHLAFNMYALYLFGALVEQAFGAARFLTIYFVSGFLASVTSFAFGLGPFGLGVGASGAVFGLLGAWVAYNFRRRGSALASANLQWALMLIGLNLVLGFSIAGIDNFAHLGGLVAGAVVGALAEGFGGSRSLRRIVWVGGLAALIVLGSGLTVSHARDVREQIPPGISCDSFRG